jgi:hypothetical protein
MLFRAGSWRARQGLADRTCATASAGRNKARQTLQRPDTGRQTADYCWLVVLAAAALVGGSLGLGGVDASLMKILFSPNAI